MAELDVLSNCLSLLVVLVLLESVRFECRRRTQLAYAARSMSGAGYWVIKNGCRSDFSYTKYEMH